MTKSRIIAFEGVDGSGKSTQAKVLAAATDTTLIRSPSDSPIGRLIRDVLGGRAPFPGAQAFQLLFCADRLARAPFVDTVDRRAVLDRWSLSGAVYGLVDSQQGEREWFDWYGRVDCASVRPDVYVVLDVSPDVAVRRVLDRDVGTSERYDRVDRVATIAGLYAKYTHFNDVPLLHVDGEMDRDAVSARVRYLLSEFFGEELYVPRGTAGA